MKLILSLAATSNNGEVVMVNDVSRVFFQAKVKRVVYVDLPAEDASDAVDNGSIDFSNAHLSESMEGTLKNNGHSGIFITSYLAH